MGSTYKIVREAEADEVFEFLRDLYEHTEDENPIGGRWTHGLVSEELKLAKILALRDQHSYIRSLILFREGDGEFEVTILGTAKAHRKQGLMRLLLADLMSFGQKKSKPVWIEVHAKNSIAIKMYRSLGFEKSGTRPKYYSDGADAVLMTWAPNGVKTE